MALATLADVIIELWKECKNPGYVARKLGLVDDITMEWDIEKVQNVIEDPANYSKIVATIKEAK